MSKLAHTRRLLNVMRRIVELDSNTSLAAVTFSRDETGVLQEKVFAYASGSQYAHAALRLLREAHPHLRAGCENCRADADVVERAIAVLDVMKQHQHAGAVH